MTESDVTLYGQSDAVNQTSKKVKVSVWLVRQVVRAARVVGPYAPLWGPHLLAAMFLSPLALFFTVPIMAGLWFHDRPIRVFADRVRVAPSWLPRFGDQPYVVPGAIPSLRVLELRCFRVARRQLFRMQWPRVCARAGVVGVIDRMPRHPKLGRSLSIGFEGREIVFLDLPVKPLPIQHPPSWPRVGHQLASTLDVADQEIVGDPDSVGWMRMYLPLRPLPRMIQLGADRPFSILQDGQELPGDFVLGVDIRGELIRWRPDQPGRSMMIIAGSQGSGKSKTADLIILQAGQRGDSIYVANPKGDAQYGWADSFASVGNTPAGRYMAVMCAVDEARRRSQVLKSLGYNNYLKMAEEEKAEFGINGRLLLVMEEIANFVKTAPRDKTRKMRIPRLDGEAVERSEFEWWMQSMDGLGELSSMGRSLGVSALFLPQHPINDNLGPASFGSTLNANCNTQMAVGQLTAAGLTSLFGKGMVTDRQELIHQSLVHGRCTFAGLSNEMGAGTRDGQLFFAADEDLEEMGGEIHGDTTEFDLMCLQAAEEAVSA